MGHYKQRTGIRVWADGVILPQSYDFTPFGFSPIFEGTMIGKRCLLLLLTVFASALVSAQTFRGTILGTVTDSSGAVISGATAKVHNQGTGLERTTRTSSDGSYSIPELPIGKYTVTISQGGFQTASIKDVTVDVAADRRVDAVLKPGEVAQKVEISGEQLAQVETTTSELGGILTSQTKRPVDSLFLGGTLG